VPDHHPAIAALEPTPLVCPAGFSLGFLDIRTRLAFERGMPGFAPPPSQSITPVRPAFDEEYFEWVDVFDAVAEGTGDFVMAEIGAGFGRWLVRGAVAARREGRPFHGIAVEAEPDHFRWLRQHCRDNGVTEDRLDLVWAAIDSEPGFVPFAAGRPDSWYGQGVRMQSPLAFPDQSARRRLKARSVLGRPAVADADQNGTIWAPRVTLVDLLAPYPRVDLVDVDVQGLELSILEPAIDDLNARVRRLHIGTHSLSVERGLRVLFGRNGWAKVYDYPSHSHSTTPHGEIDFADGVQTWINPRLDPGRPEPSPDRGGDQRSVETARVKRVSRTASIEAEVKRLGRQIERLRQKNASLKEKLSRSREKHSSQAGRDTTAKKP